MHGFNSAIPSTNVIEVPKKVHRPKVINSHKREPLYPDVDECHFLSKAFGKTVFRPKNRNVTPREDVIKYADDLYFAALKDLCIGDAVSPDMKEVAIGRF